jgi:chemotaxis signal transduction protein
VIDYRGKIIPVLNLRHYLGLVPRAQQPPDHLIILRIDERFFAIRVDRGLDVSLVDPQTNEEPPFDHSASTVLHAPDGTVIVLNTTPLLALLDDASHQNDSKPHWTL